MLECTSPILRDFIMQSSALRSLPPKLRRSLAKLGADIAIARRKRNLTVMMMAERIGSARSTYLKIEKGDPAVSMGVYAMTLFVLGFGDAIGDLVDARRDEIGLLLDAQRLPKRVRRRKVSTGAYEKNDPVVSHFESRSRLATALQTSFPERRPLFEKIAFSDDLRKLGRFSPHCRSTDPLRPASGCSARR